MRAIQILALAVVAALVSSPIRAFGPYVWIDTKNEVLFDSDNAVAALRETWVFDLNYSKLALRGIKREAETATVTDLAALARTNVTSLAEYGYFVVAEMDGKKTLFRRPFDYYLEERPDDRLALHFTLPFAEPIKPGKALSIQIIDPGHFAAFDDMEKSQAHTLINAPAQCSSKAVSGSDQKNDPQGFVHESVDFWQAYTVVSCMPSQPGEIASPH